MRGQFSISELLAIVRRRRLLLIAPPILVTIVCAVGAFLLPRKFESSTTIWVQRDEILNPLVSFSMAVALTSADRLETFNEIVYSRRTIEAMIDSMGLASGVQTGIQMDELIEQVRRNIRTDRKGSDSFSITYIDTDPVRAQRAVSLVAEIFIQTRLKGERQRNKNTVDFFETKLEEYQKKFGESQNEVVVQLRQRLKELPTGSSPLSQRIDAIDGDIRTTDHRNKDLVAALAKLDLFPDAFRTDAGRLALADLQRMESLPYGTELRDLVRQYDQIASRYTERHPDVAKLEFQIQELVGRIKSSVQGEIQKNKDQIASQENKRALVVDELLKYAVSEKMDQDVESNYSLYRQLYNEMKVKLEQAKTVQELGKNAESSFIIIDPARIPSKPTKPNRSLIVGAGFALGILFGIVSATIAELLDATVRSPKDLEVYHKPVIALLPDGRY